MAQVVNIRRDVDDKFYRYKMPSLLTKIEGKGNGIKTVIPNMSDVSRALSRPPTYPTKFFGCELGAQTSFDEKGDRYIVNGAHDATRLRELLDAFIDKFVLCAECKNPETDLIIVTRTEDIFRDCKACGARTGVDMRHKLTTFIIKNPPKKPKKDKKAKAADKDKDGKDNGSAEEEGAAEGGGSDDDDEFTKKLKADAAQLPTAEQAERGEEDWALDTSEAAVKARQKEMAALNLGDSDEGEGDGADPYSELAVWLEGNRGSSAADVYKKIQELGIEKKHKVAEILGRALFTENIEKEIPGYQPLFAKVITSEKHQKSLLGGLERFVGVEHPALVAAVPKILMAFYQVDALEEDVIIQWCTHVSRKYVDRDVSKRVRKAGDPFIKWLAEADDESE